MKSLSLVAEMIEQLFCDKNKARLTYFYKLMIDVTFLLVNIHYYQTSLYKIVHNDITMGKHLREFLT
jgi:hypothetical protein